MRARELVSAPIDDELEAEMLVRLASQVRSAASRLNWRAAMQARSTRIFRVLTAVGHAVQLQDGRRLRTRSGWVFVANDETQVAAITVTTATSGRTVHDLAEPLPLMVHRPDLVDVDVLLRLEQEGLVHLTLECGA